MKQTLNLASAKLLMPSQPDPTKWKASGDPRPLIRMASGVLNEVVIEEGTPFTVKMNANSVSSNGSGKSNSYKQKAVPTGPLTFQLEPTSIFTKRYYRTLKNPDGSPRRILKDKAALTLPWVMDLRKPANTRYKLSFQMKFDAAFEPPPSEYYFTIPLQGWQGLGHHPPLELLVLPEHLPGLVDLRIIAEDETTEVEARDSKLVGEFALTKGDWHTLEWELQPNYMGQGGTGVIELAVDATQIISWEGDWGYKPAADRQPLIQFSVGMYRMSQPKHQALSFKQFKFETL